jgi:uncharacterized protein YggU (UPF0235/DUF167 family)
VVVGAPGGVEIAVWVVPGSSRRRVGTIRDGALRVWVTAPAEGGRANREVAAVVAAAIGAKRGEVVAGIRNRRKRVFVAGVGCREAFARLTAPDRG